MMDWYWKLKSRKLRKKLGNPVGSVSIRLVNLDMVLSYADYDDSYLKKEIKFAQDYIEDYYHYTDKNYLVRTNDLNLNFIMLDYDFLRLDNISGIHDLRLAYFGFPIRASVELKTSDGNYFNLQVKNKEFFVEGLKYV